MHHGHVHTQAHVHGWERARQCAEQLPSSKFIGGREYGGLGGQIEAPTVWERMQLGLGVVPTQGGAWGWDME